MSGVSRLGHFSSLARSSSSSSTASLSSSLTPRGRGCSSSINSATLAQQRRAALPSANNQSFHGGGGGRFKSTTAAAPARLNKKNESSSSSSSSSLVSSFWDAAASTIQSGLSTSAHQSSVYFQMLRWKAANALMTSLSDSERQQLLQRLDILPKTTNNNDNDNISSINSNGINTSTTAGAADQVGEMMENNKSSSTKPVVLSVAEAVAAARVQEAMRSSIAETTTTKSTAAAAAQQREELWRQAQQAAHARVATEITALQQHLEKQEAAANANHDDNNNAAANHVEKECSILGPVVYDLGYKRCHVVSASQLSSIPVWQKQRSFRHDRAKSMAKDKLKTLHLGMPGVISLHEDLQGNLSIVDGQHRVGMMAILAEEMQQQQQQQDDSSNNNNALLDLTKILVEVYPEKACAPNGATTTGNDGDSSNHAADLFVEINKAEPVKLVDLPGMGAKKSEANVINTGAHLVQQRFPEMFSASTRCRSPHLNLDNLRDALFQAQVVTRAKLKSPKALEMWLLEQNNELKQKYQQSDNNANGAEESTSSWSISKTALEKARKYDFYLGLETSWLSAVHCTK